MFVTNFISLSTFHELGGEEFYIDLILEDSTKEQLHETVAAYGCVKIMCVTHIPHSLS
jgi:hypothetical protein